MKEEEQLPGDVWPKCEQMAQMGVDGALARCTPYDRESKQWMENQGLNQWLYYNFILNLKLLCWYLTYAVGLDMILGHYYNAAVGILFQYI